MIDALMRERPCLYQKNVIKEEQLFVRHTIINSISKMVVVKMAINTKFPIIFSLREKRGFLLGFGSSILDDSQRTKDHFLIDESETIGRFISKSIVGDMSY
jgi:hypothetical protein